MPTVLSHPQISGTIHPWEPKLQEPCCQGFPLLLLKLRTCPPTLPEYVVDMSWTQSHWGPPEDAPPGSQAAHASLSAVQQASLPSGDLQSHNVPHHRHSPPRCQRCWVLQGHQVLALPPVYVALVLPSVSAHCALVRHCIGHCPYSPPGQSGRSTPRCSGSPCHLVRRTGTHALNTFSMLSGDPSATSQSSTRAHAENHSHTVPHAMWWPLASSIQWSLRLPYLLGILLPLLWRLRPLYLLGILPTMPIVLLIQILTPIVFAVHIVHTVRWTQGRQGAS